MGSSSKTTPDHSLSIDSAENLSDQDNMKIVNLWSDQLMFWY